MSSPVSLASLMCPTSPSPPAPHALVSVLPLQPRRADLWGPLPLLTSHLCFPLRFPPSGAEVTRYRRAPPGARRRVSLWRAEMAAPGVPVTVTVTYSNEKHSIQVASQQEDGEPTLQDMAVLIEQVTGVPVPFQKLIYKGKSLKELEQPLSALGVKNGCKVMLIGKRGFLAKDLQAEALKQLDKRIKGTAEQFMKILEQIDAINLPENFSDCKLKKKGLVKRVQVFLAQCDTVEGNIGQEMDKLQSKNLALAE
ncbi:BAG family molecular chaperone regulator 1 isoform X2 [Chroicocephalus ridibundus]|uniref:BAG family molecular chaperone regulator 1 isoform X2 n=2 Tax=Laridae TaxID=8910 RepID=UPI002FDE843E